MKKLTKEQFIDDLNKLISFKTLTSDQAQNAKALDFIFSKISQKAIIKRIKNDNTEILIASNLDTKKPDICYLVHVDVVAGKPEQFKMEIKNNIAYGRGVSDMKFSIPIGYALLNDLIEKKSSVSFALVITTDEETGGFQGAAFLAKKYRLKPKVIIVPDGGDNFIFINKSKGVCALRVDSSGVPAHSSRIWDGKNALEPIIRLCNEVLERYEGNNKKESWKTTVNVGKIQGGISANQVCPEAHAILDFRFPESTTFDVIYREVKEIANKIDTKLKISTYSIGAPTSVNASIPLVQDFLKSFSKKLGRKIKVQGTYGASDARHFANSNAPILMIKPNGGDIHCDTEYIDIDSCLMFYEVLQDFLRGLEEKVTKSGWHK